MFCVFILNFEVIRLCFRYDSQVPDLYSWQVFEQIETETDSCAEIEENNEQIMRQSAPHENSEADTDQQHYGENPGT